MVSDTDEWKLRIEDLDSYWRRQYEALRKAGFPKCVAEPAIIKTERQMTMSIAYA